MIKQIKIKNFQSHLSSCLNLSSGVNVIVGSSDSGKSAVFRALNWVFTNRPLGTSFIRWGQKECSVDVALDEKTEITRKRSGTENIYLSNGIKLLAGQEVPEAVQGLLSIDPVINIQHQISSPFLLSSSPGEVAQFFNDIAGLSDIDKSVKNLQSSLRKIGQEQTFIEKQYNETSQELDSFAFLEPLEQAVTGLEVLEKKQNSIASDKRNIAAKLQQIQAIQAKLGPAEKKAKAKGALARLDTDMRELVTKKERARKLEQLCSQYQAVQDALEITSAQARALKPIQALLKIQKQAEEKERQAARIQQLLAKIELVESKGLRAIEAAKSMKKELEQLMPDTCPLCEQEIK